MTKHEYFIKDFPKKWEVKKEEAKKITELIRVNEIGKKDIRETLILLRLFEGHTTKAKLIWGARVFLNNLIEGNSYDKKERKIIVSEDFEDYSGIEFALLLGVGGRRRFEPCILLL
jgi:hypothetical protein